MHGTLCTCNYDVHAVATINRDVGDLPKPCEARLPMSGGTEAVYATVRAVGHVDATLAVERDIVRFPGIGQQRVGWLIGRGGRLPVATQHEAVQGEDAQAVIAGIADEEIAGTDADAMRLAELSWPLAYTTEARDSLKTTLADI